MKRNNTFSQKPADVSRTWYVIDASEAPVGRVASKAANLIIGKHKPTYSPHVDGGDAVVVINADKAYFTGKKDLQKEYFSHSGYPGGISSKTVKEQFAEDSSAVIEKAVYGMLPKNKLRPDMLKRLKVFAGEEHDHAAQQPQKVEV